MPIIKNTTPEIAPKRIDIRSLFPPDDNNECILSIAPIPHSTSLTRQRIIIDIFHF